MRRLLLLPLAVLATALVAAPGPISGSTTTTAAPTTSAAVDLPWPDRRFAPCGALDPDDGVLYAFGGRADDGATHLGDLWALDLGNRGETRPTWQLAAAAGAPSAPPAVRSCAADWDDAAQRLLVFGGWNGVTHEPGLRAFDPATHEWRQLCDALSCGPGPAPRRASQLVVDEARNRVLVFGGTNGPYLDDLWSLSLDSSSWSRVDAPGPRPLSRGGHAMAIDTRRDALWLFGGTRPGADLGDLWRLDLATGTWSEIAPECAPGCPSPRSGATLTHDEAGDRLVLHGGWESSSNVYRRETWILDDLDGTPTWSQVTPAGESPQARFFHLAGYDPDAQRLVVFGGGANASAYKDAFGLTLPLDGSAPAWHTLSPTTAITARDQVTVALDGGVLTAFGGFGSGTFPGSVGAGTHLADTWQRDLRRRAGWRLATPAEETQVAIAREGTAYAHDAERHRLLMFGGLTGDTTLADVWMADLRRPGRPRWQQLCSLTSCGPGPTARWGAHAVYDPVADRLVVFGGSMGTGATTNDVWALELSGPPTWHELIPAGPAPAARWSAGYGYDPVRRRLVVFGGQTGPDGTGSPLQDTWALALDGDAGWTRLAESGPQPEPRRSPAAAVRVGPDGAQFLIASGLTASTGAHHNDVWSLDLGDDSAQWVQLAVDSPSTAPAPRRSASAVWDPATDRIVIGFGRDGDQFLDETWSFDPSARAWYQAPG